MSSSELNTTDNNTSLQQSEPTLCSNGCGFFGTAATNGLCSKCYKDFIKSVAALSLKATPCSFKKAELDQNGVSTCSKETSFSCEVAKKKRCGMCNKKVGLIGFKCRCGNVFCGLHRYAEAHGCEFDFKTKGKSEIAKANPVVKADKLERL